MKKGGRYISAFLFLLFLAGMYFGALSEGNIQDKCKEEIIIAVLDTGYTGDSNRVLKGIATIGDEEHTEDGNGHGTKITEMLLQYTEKEVKILPIKIADYMGCSTEKAAYEGVKYAMENKVDMIHMSLNMSNLHADSKLVEIMNDAINSGIEVVVSAGNNGKDVQNVFPANVEGAVVVSAVDEENEFSTYSNYGSTIDFAAYGYYMGETGTSYAAARVTAMLAEEAVHGGDISALRNKAIDMGMSGKDNYYGYGILTVGRKNEERIQEKAYIGKTKNDIGYHILDIDWRQINTETLNQYFAETYRAYVGMYLSKLDERELTELKEKADILNTNVLVQDFKLAEDGMQYYEVASYEENFVENAIKEYQEYEKKLVVSAEWLMQKNNAYFVVSSENRNDIYYFQIEGFSYTTDTSESLWFSIFNPDELNVTRTIMKQTTEFGAVSVAGMTRYLRAAHQFAVRYMNPSTEEVVEKNNLYAIDAEVDTGMLNYGLSIEMEGYSNHKLGYHTEETDIVAIPYNYAHIYEEYSYEEYKEPLRYIFSYYEESSNSTEYALTPQRVEVQSKNFKKLINTDQTIWYNGEYKKGYNYSDVDEELSLEEKLSKYLKSYSTKIIADVNVYSTESSLTDTGFTINADLTSSLGMQWNNGETTTVAVKNDIPEYNFPLVPNAYEIQYDGNGATSGTMPNTAMAYDEEKELEECIYSKTGYIFNGWSTTEDGEAKYADRQVVSNLTSEHKATVTLYAVWKPITYTVIFDGNGATEGVMSNMSMEYDLPASLAKNLYIREEQRKFAFCGWSVEFDIGNPIYLDEEIVVNLTEQQEGIVTLYAVWDECPWIIAQDLYYALEEAQSGQITYEELMSHASAEDREAGGMILPGIDEQKGTSFTMPSYVETRYTELLQEDNISEVYQVIDSAGNKYEKEIIVHIVDTTPVDVTPKGTTRFINEKYYEESYEKGGLEENSIWKVNSEYAEIIQKAFENSRNDTPVFRFSFSYEQILLMKEFVQSNGLGNSESTDALARFYEQFMMSEMEN